MTKKELIEKAKALGVDTTGLTVKELQNAINALTPPAPPVTGGEATPETGDPGDLQGEGASQGDGESPEGASARPDAIDPDYLSALSGLQAGGAAPDDEEDDEEDPEPEPEEEQEAEDQDGPVFTDSGNYYRYNGNKYRFKKSAPERFNYLKQNKTQEEWLNDEVAMELLIEGRSHLIIKIKE